MPFMIGPSPIRRTTKFLESGKIYFRENVKIFSINFKPSEEHHRGARDFAFWYLCQIQYKNPKVQCLTFKNLTPTPFIRIFLEDAKSVLIDIDSREKEEILDHLVNFTAICKTPKELKSEENIFLRKEDFSYFGFDCNRHCMCEIFGQVPCPSLVTLPDSWRGKGRPHLSLKKKFRLPPCYMVKGLEDEKDDE